MKKLLGLLAATGLVASTGATVVSCGDPAPTDSSIAVEISADKSDATKELTIAFVKDASFVASSDKTTASILDVTFSEVSESVLKSTVTFKVKDGAARTADVTEKITVKYNNAEVAVYSVKIVKVATVADKELKINDIKTNAKITGISGKKTLAEYNQALAEITDIEGVASMLAADKDGATDHTVIVTVTAKSGYKLDSSTFEVVGAYTPEETPEG